MSVYGDLVFGKLQVTPVIPFLSGELRKIDGSFVDKNHALPCSCSINRNGNKTENTIEIIVYGSRAGVRKWGATLF